MAARKNTIAGLFDWSGFIPSLVFCLIFEIVPVLFLVRGSLIEKDTGQFAYVHYTDLQRPLYIHSLINSIRGNVAAAFSLTSFRIVWLVSMMILWVGSKGKFAANEAIQAR